MSKRTRRILITVGVILAAVGVVVLPPMLGSPPPGVPPEGERSIEDNLPNDPDAPETADAPDADLDADADPDAPLVDATEPDAPEIGPAEATPPVEPADALALEGLRAVPPAGAITPENPPAPLGSLDPREARFFVEFSAHGAGVRRLAFNDYWESVNARHDAAEIMQAVERGEASVDDLPDARYVLFREQVVRYWRPDAPDAEFVVPALGARAILIEGPDGRRHAVDLAVNVWSADGPGRFVTEIVNAEGRPVLRVRRAFRYDGAGFDLRLDQSVENLTDRPLTIEFIQYGPGDLTTERGSNMFDRRRFRVGLQPVPGERPSLIDPTALLYERTAVIDLVAEGREGEDLPLWPTEESLAEGYRLAWFASTNRYFAAVVHPPFRREGLASFSIEPIVAEIRPTGDLVPSPGGGWSPPEILLTELRSAPLPLPPGETLTLDLGVYAGPLSRDVLAQAPYDALEMAGLVLYQMSGGICGICTFQWLAILLLWFLDVLHDYVLFDWALAIIALVVVVRAILHPITKRSQINMQRFGRQMQAMKPEVERLQKKYADDPKRMQQEQMRLMREHHINPMNMLGCLPMFLQTPIWIALYAMLYFAFELRHEPAFFGLFQRLTDGAWPFLADLSAPDRFVAFSPVDLPWFLPVITGLNVLPILMGLVFFVQQKYLTPPSTGTMTKEQEQTQKMMKVMTVVLFPLFLYAAPSGLTLYILTSSTIGILESRHIRAHIDRMDLTAPPKKKASTKVKKKDPVARAYQLALERAKEKQRRKQASAKSFKKRK